MTLPTFVATASGGDTTSGASFSLTRDSAATLNRVRVFLLYRETNSAITASGWSSIGQAVNSGSPNLYGDFLWHRDNGSDPASWTISWTGSSWFGWVICSWDNVVTSGTPVEAFASGSGNSDTFTGPTITTLGTDRLRIFGNVFFYSSASSFGNPSVGTRRGSIGALAQLTDEQRASAGATGTITIQANNTETGRWAAGCFGLIGVSAAAPQTITLSTVSLAGSVPTGDAVPGAVSILGSTPTLIGSVPVMSVISGTANVLLSALALASSPQASSVASGGVSVASNTLGLAGSVPASSISPGATTVLLNRYGSLRFYGNGTGNIDRARIPLDTGSVSTAADVGAGDFTYECWLKCLYADNTSSSIGDARNSNIFFDRDIWGHERG